MATNTGETGLALGTNPSCVSNTMQDRNVSRGTTSWADRSENVSVYSACDQSMENARFFIVKNLQGSFAQVSPFLIEKSLQGMVGDTKCVKKLRSGDLLIEVRNSSQAEKLKKCTSFGNISVNVCVHGTLNSSRGVMSEQDLLYVSEGEILENLKDQKVTGVRRINIHRDGKIIPTKHLILTFNTPTIPTSLKAGYLNCNIRSYIPNPLRCFQCQRFGHSKASCRGTVTCAKCSVSGHESETCSAPARCVNCHGDHPAYSKTCHKWKLEKEIQTIKTKQNIPYLEARKIVESRSPTVGVTYATTASKSVPQYNKKFQTIATQTDGCIEKTISPTNKNDTKSATEMGSTLKIATQSSKTSLTPKLPPSKAVIQRANLNEPFKKSTASRNKNADKKQKRTGSSLAKGICKSSNNISPCISTKKTNKKMKADDPTLNLYASDLSGEEDDMSTSSENHEDMTQVHI